MNIVILVRAYDKRRIQREEYEGGDGNVDADNPSGNDLLCLEDNEAHNPQNPANQDMDQSSTLVDDQAHNMADGISPLKDPQLTWDYRNSIAVIPIVYEDEEVIHC
jgi:hypothetical protein